VVIPRLFVKSNIPPPPTLKCITIAFSQEMLLIFAKVPVNIRRNSDEGSILDQTENKTTHIGQTKRYDFLLSYKLTPYPIVLRFFIFLFFFFPQKKEDIYPSYRLCLCHLIYCA
jgi:hypothetical protein